MIECGPSYGLPTSTWTIPNITLVQSELIVDPGAGAGDQVVMS